MFDHIIKLQNIDELQEEEKKKERKCVVDKEERWMGGHIYVAKYINSEMDNPTSINLNASPFSTCDIVSMNLSKIISLCD